MTYRILKPVEVPTPARPKGPAALARNEGLDDDPIVKLLIERFEAKLVRVDVEEDSPQGEA